MKLKEAIDIINKELDKNMKKKTIKTGGGTFGDAYDEVNGRKVFNDRKMIELISQVIQIDEHFIQINKAINMNMFDMKFKLKRKKSGIKDRFNTELMTYIEIKIDEDYKNKLDIDIQELKDDYLNNIYNRYNGVQEENNCNNFQNNLSKLNLTIEDFKNLLGQYNLLSQQEKESLKLL